MNENKVLAERADGERVMSLWRVKKLEEEGAERNRKQDAELC